MTLTVGVLKETLPGEHRVAIVPASVPALRKAGLDVVVETGAGVNAGYLDQAYEQQGARLAARDDVLSQAHVVLQVRTASASGPASAAALEGLRAGQTVIGLADALYPSTALTELANRGVTLFALELMPRITRAQSMDVLSSMATIAGYKAVLLAANTLPRIFPMLMTAAGTISAARVFVMGAGVAGLQAIATARRLGARVDAYDVRPAVKEQVQSLGARFVELPLETTGAEDKGGYAVAQDERFYERQRELLTQTIAGSDVVITTALIPGQRAPILVTAAMVQGMAPGSVIVDLAAERGGNCELTQYDETVVAYGVTIHGPANLPATVPYHASQMFSRNVTTFLLHLVKNGEIALDLTDQITADTLVTRNGEIVHPRVRQAQGLPQLEPVQSGA